MSLSINDHRVHGFVGWYWLYCQYFQQGEIEIKVFGVKGNRFPAFSCNLSGIGLFRWIVNRCRNGTDFQMGLVF